MQTLQIILLIVICVVILHSIWVGWVATRPASRSGNAKSREGNHGTD
jgi:hypothetical protein